MIIEGRVTVNGAVITELGTKADPEHDHIKVDGKRVGAPERLVYLAMNKPKDCMSTVSDPEGRATVMDLLRGVKARVYPVGRLDYSSEGLLLLTNDGEFAKRITSAASHVTKTYAGEDQRAALARPGREIPRRRSAGRKKTAPAGLKLMQRAQNPWYEVRLIEGRQNQIRLMFKHFGRLVEKLRRVRIGFLELGSLQPGKFRHLTPAEVARFRKLLAMPVNGEER